MTEFFIGVDGGGTGCRAVVAGSDGAILGSGRSGSANIVTDPQTALINVIAAVDNAFDDAGLDKAHYANSHAVLGLAGGNVEGAGVPIERGLPFAHSDVEFDGVIALQGRHSWNRSGLYHAAERPHPFGRRLGVSLGRPRQRRAARSKPAAGKPACA